MLESVFCKSKGRKKIKIYFTNKLFVSGGVKISLGHEEKFVMFYLSWKSVQQLRLPAQVPGRHLSSIAFFSVPPMPTLIKQDTTGFNSKNLILLPCGELNTTDSFLIILSHGIPAW